MNIPRKRSITRINNCLRVVAELRTRNLSRDDISKLLAFSDSGVRKYIADLLRARVMVEVGRIGIKPGWSGQGVYAIGEEADISEYCDRPVIKREKNPGGRAAYAMALRDPSRHVHVLHDDAEYHVRVPRKTALHDPLALPAGFFKPSADFIERRQVERATVPQPTGFAALEFARFERRPA